MPRKAPPAKPIPTADVGQSVIDKYEPMEAADAVPEPVEEAPVAEAPAPPPVETKPAVPKYLLRAAKQAGLSEDDLDGLPPADIEKAITMMNSTRREVEQARDRDEAGRFVKQPEVPETPFSLADLGVDVKDLNADETTQDILTKLMKPLAAKIKSLETDLAEAKARDQRRETNAQFDQLDQLFNDMPDVFGKGARHKLAKGSPEMLRRVAVINQLKSLASNDRGDSLAEDFERVATSLFGTLAPKAPAPSPVEDATIPDPKGFLNGATTIRPVDRATKPEPKGTRLAEKNLAMRLNQRAASTVDTTEFDELPD